MRSLMNLRKIAAVAAVVGMTICLVPEAVQAQRARWSGSATNASDVNFDLVPVEDQESDLNRGLFLGAIENFNIEGSFTNSNVCGAAICPPGNVTVTRLTTDSNGNVSNLRIGGGGDFGGNEVSLEGLQTIFDSLNSNNINFSNGVLRYDVTFVGTSPEPDLIWFVQSNDSNLINDLSRLNQFSQVVGILPSDVNVFDNGGVNNGGIIFISQQIPESSNTIGLLGLGALGVVSLLQHKKRLKKFSDKDILLSESQEELKISL